MNGKRLEIMSTNADDGLDSKSFFKLSKYLLIIELLFQRS